MTRWSARARWSPETCRRAWSRWAFRRGRCGRSARPTASSSPPRESAKRFSKRPKQRAKPAREDRLALSGDGLAHELTVVLIDEDPLGLLGRHPAALVNLVQRLEAIVREDGHRPPADRLGAALAVGVLL